MPSGESEDIGGLSVSVGASNKQLAADLAEANRLLEKWAAQRYNVQVGATTPSGPSGSAPARSGRGGAVPGGAPAVNAGGGGVSNTAMPPLQREVLTLQRRVLQKQVSASGGVTPQPQGTTRANQTAINRASAANYLNANPSTPTDASINSATVIGSPASKPSPVARDQPSQARSQFQDQFDREEAKRAERARQRQEREDAGSSAEQQRGERVVAQEQERQARVSTSRQVRGAIAIRRAQDAREIQASQVERNAQAAVATRTADVLTAGRTKNTAASTVGGFLGGPGRERLRLETDLTAARANSTGALRQFTAIESIAARADEEGNVRHDKSLKQYAESIRQLPAYKKAQDDVTASLARQDKAQASLDKFAKNPINLARNLLAVTAAGFAFGAGLKVVDVALSAVAPAIGAAIDQASGFGATSNKVTQALAQQTTAAHGNVAAVLAQADAQASLSSSAADALDSQLKLTTQIKSGAGAASQTGGLFRAAIGANQQTPQGLLGGYGGIGGGSLLAQQLGGGTGLAETIQSSFADITSSISDLSSSRVITPSTDLHARQYLTAGQQQNLSTPTDQRPARLAQLADDRTKLEDTYNQAAKRGAQAQGLATTQAFHFAQAVGDQADRVKNSDLPAQLKDLASKSNEVMIGPNGFTTSVADATKGLEQVGIGLSITPPDQLGRANLFAVQQQQRESAANLPAIQSQQAFALASQVNGIARQQDFAAQTQIPAQQALSAIANPNVPVTTGIAKQDQASVNRQLKEATSLQGQLNDEYAQGQKVLQDTYKADIVKFFGGPAAGQAFQASLDAITTTGKEIAGISASISNEQAGLQAKQYNEQLFISKRSLQDINGLVGQNLLGAGQSFLGILEKQNLALSRQGQLLQFQLAQRQIGFQIAQAGFNAPGRTPEEIAANVKEAKFEASFAQKQLNINKQQFSNQVKIVDIGNLRQGRDLAKQIGLLIAGRQVTIDTAAAQAKILRLNQLQQHAVSTVSTYLNKVDNLAAVQMTNIQQLEAAYGNAIGVITVKMLKDFNIYINGVDAALNGLGGGGTGTTNTGGTATGRRPNASGGIYQTQGPTAIGNNALAGEAGSETLLILSHPRAASGMGGPAGTVIVNFNGDIKTNDLADLDKITRAVTKAMGRTASNLGLRSPGG